MSGKPWTELEVKLLHEHYHTKGRVGCQQYIPNRSIDCIGAKANRMGLRCGPLEIRKKQNLGKFKHPELCKVKLSTFKFPSSPYTAYALGLLWADGYISERHIKLSNKQDDGVYFLPWLLQTGAWSHCINKTTKLGWSDQLAINTTNRGLAEYLRSLHYGPHDRKTAAKVLSTLPSNLIRFWLLGLIDGDGCFYYQEKQKLRQFQITSSIDQDWTPIEEILTSLGISFSVDRRITKKDGKRRSNIRVFGGTNLEKLGNFIYQSIELDGIGLPRKYAKWQECMNSRVRKIP